VGGLSCYIERIERTKEFITVTTDRDTQEEKGSFVEGRQKQKEKAIIITSFFSSCYM